MLLEFTESYLCKMGSHGQPPADSLDTDFEEFGQTASHPTAGAADMIPRVIDEFLECIYCTRMFTKAKMAPVGDRATAKKYKCKPCTAASKYLERVAESQGKVAVKVLSDRRNKRPIAYAKDVSRLRINNEDDPEPSQADFVGLSIACGQNAHAERCEIAATLSEIYFCFKQIQDEDTVVYFNERQYKQYFKLFEGHSQAEVDTFWLESLEKFKNVLKTDTNGNPTVPTRMPQICRSIFGKGQKRECATPEQIVEEEMPAKKAKMQELLTEGFSDPHFNGVRDQFGQHAAASSAVMEKEIKRGARSNMSQVRQIVGGSVGEHGSDTASVCSRVSSATGHGGSASIPVGDDDASLSNTAKDLEEKLGELNLTKIRTSCRTLATQFLKLADGPKTCMPKMLGVLVQKMGESHVEVVENHAVENLKLLRELTQVLVDGKPHIPHWTKEASKDKATALVKHIVDGELILEKLQEAFDNLRGARTTEVNDSASSRRAQGLFLARTFKAIRHPANEFPLSMTRYLFANVLHVTKEDASFKPETDKGVIASSETAASLDDFKNVLFFRPSSTSPINEAFQKLVPAFSGRVDKQMAKLFQPQALFRNNIAVRPAGSPHDAVPSMEWVPEILKDADVMPEGLEGHAHLFLVSGQKLSYFQGMGSVPYDGLPHVVVGIKGSFLMNVWPMQAVLDKGGLGFDFRALVDGMKPIEVEAFMAQHATSLVIEVPIPRPFYQGVHIYIYIYR
jgi:hypothetical protein